MGNRKEHVPKALHRQQWLEMEPFPRKEAWAIGIEGEKNSFGMCAGPFFTEDGALEEVGLNNMYRVIHFLPDGTDEVTWIWRGDRWLATK